MIEKKNREEGRGYILEKVAVKGLTEKRTFKYRPEGRGQADN